jgi:hypothetical protein
MLSAEGRLGDAATGAKLEVESATAEVSQKGERFSLSCSAVVDAADSFCCKHSEASYFMCACANNAVPVQEPHFS